MIAQLVEMFEEAFGVVASDAVGTDPPQIDDSSQQLFQSCTTDSLEEFREKLRILDAASRPPSYGPTELVPRLWRAPHPTAWNNYYPAEPGIVHPATAVSALIYAHKVEVPNPFLAAYAEGSFTRYPKPGHTDCSDRVLDLRRALWSLLQLQPLADGHLVVLGPTSSRPSSASFSPKVKEMIGAAVESAAGMEAYLELLSIGREEIRAIASEVDSEGLTGEPLQRRIHDFVTSDVPFAARSDEVNHSLACLLSNMWRSLADLWCPSRSVESLLVSAHQKSVGLADHVLTWTTSITLPSIAHLSPPDQLAIRRDSETFEAWRSVVSKSFEQFELKTSLGLASEAAKAASEVLVAGSEEVVSTMRRDLRRTWSGWVRDLTIGATASAPGAAIGDLKTALIGGAGGVLAGSATSAGWDLLARRRTTAAGHTVLTHSLVLQDALRLIDDQ